MIVSILWHTHTHTHTWRPYLIMCVLHWFTSSSNPRPHYYAGTATISTPNRSPHSPFPEPWSRRKSQVARDDNCRQCRRVLMMMSCPRPCPRYFCSPPCGQAWLGPVFSFGQCRISLIVSDSLARWHYLIMPKPNTPNTAYKYTTVQ